MTRAWTNLETLEENNILKEDIDSLKKVSENFQIKVSIAMKNQLLKTHSKAIYQQFIPQSLENTILNDEVLDPIEDFKYSPMNGLVHRYTDRVLIKITQLCAVYCRFCFRKEMIGNKGDSLTQSEIESILDYIKAHKEIWEVILTGGDPLILSVNRLQKVMDKLTQINHVKSIRIHTRIPVSEPNLISDDLLNYLSFLIDNGQQIIFVIHINHSDELTFESRQLLLKLRKTGVMLLSQSVLLKGINDNLEDLSQLCRNLIEVGIKPYYLHQLDFARGTSHFRVHENDAIKLIRELRKTISGVAVPTLIQEIPGGKKPLF